MWRGAKARHVAGAVEHDEACVGAARSSEKRGELGRGVGVVTRTLTTGPRLGADSSSSKPRERWLPLWRERPVESGMAMFSRSSW